MKHEIDPKTGMLKELLKPTGDPRCHCPRACLFHGTCYSPHEKPGGAAAQRRLKQLAKVPFKCPGCDETHPGTQRNIVSPTVVLCDYCFGQRGDSRNFSIKEISE